jgi:hypothetical protein
MTSVAVKKQLNNYIPLLTTKQQALLLEMVKNILQVDNSEKRISIKQYNKELAEAEKQIVAGKFITQSDLVKESEKW